MHLSGKTGKMLTNIRTWQRRGDRIEFAADFNGPGWFHIPHIQVAGTTIQKQDDARIRLRTNSLHVCGCLTCQKAGGETARELRIPHNLARLGETLVEMSLIQP